MGGVCADIKHNKQDDKAAGLFIDIWKLWAKYNNYTIEFVDGVIWNNALDLAKNKEVDFFLGSNPYKNWMFSSDSFYELTSSFFILAKNNDQILAKSELI